MSAFPNKSVAPAGGHIDDHQGVSDANARAGLWLFFVYLAAYAGFMGLAVFAPQAMGRPALAGVNLAITYGMGLIAGALVVAALYMWMCGRNARMFNGDSGKRPPEAPR
jgi:uncharacterized membrane protein (DUF485 family)